MDTPHFIWLDKRVGTFTEALEFINELAPPLRAKAYIATLHAIGTDQEPAAGRYAVIYPDRDVSTT